MAKFDAVLSLVGLVVAAVAAASGNWALAATDWGVACYFKLCCMERSKTP